MSYRKRGLGLTETWRLRRSFTLCQQLSWQRRGSRLIYAVYMHIDAMLCQFTLYDTCPFLPVLIPFSHRLICRIIRPYGVWKAFNHIFVCPMENRCSRENTSWPSVWIDTVGMPIRRIFFFKINTERTFYLGYIRNL